MYVAAIGWLMTTLDADPLMVSLVQVASSLPMFLFALPAGALTDVVDKRKFMITIEIAITILSAVFAVLVWLHLVSPWVLLTLAFLIGVASAMEAPVWQAIVPELVPKRDLSAAVADNSAGINVSRAVGPALGGVLTAALGIVAPFWINAVSNIGIVGALIWWRPPQNKTDGLPAERFAQAMRIGLRYATNSPPLRATFTRAAAFFLFASAYWALLPLVTRNQVAGGPEIYGVLLGAIGLSAVSGVFVLGPLKAKLGADRIVALGTIGTAIALILFGLARDPITAASASIIAGISWIVPVATLNVSAQVALPNWVRGRGLAMYVTVMFGSLSAGSAIWGQVANMAGLPVALFIAAAGALLAIPLTWRAKLQAGAGFDLTPSMHWPTPIVTQEVDRNQGPVLVTVEYRVLTEHRDAFLIAIDELARERRRDGAYAWGIFEDTALQGSFLETFFVTSWLEHLRQHERVTNADRVLQDKLLRLLEDPNPKVTHLIAAEPVSGP